MDAASVVVTVGIEAAVGSTPVQRAPVGQQAMLLAASSVQVEPWEQQAAPSEGERVVQEL